MCCTGANTFIDLRVLPSDVANLRAALESLPASENRMYLYDSKNETKDNGRVASNVPFRRPPSLDKKNFRMVAEAL